MSTNELRGPSAMTGADDEELVGACDPGPILGNWLLGVEEVNVLGFNSDGSNDTITEATRPHTHFSSPSSELASCPEVDSTSLDGSRSSVRSTSTSLVGSSSRSISPASEERHLRLDIVGPVRWIKACTIYNAKIK